MLLILCRLHLQLIRPQFVELGQRFTLRNDGVTVGTGVVTELLPALTDVEKDKKNRKKAMREEVEKLGFWWVRLSFTNSRCSPYGADFEKRLKPDYSKSPKPNPETAQAFEHAKPMSTAKS